MTSAADIMQFLVLLSDKSYEIQGNHAFEGKNMEHASMFTQTSKCLCTQIYRFGIFLHYSSDKGYIGTTVY